MRSNYYSQKKAHKITHTYHIILQVSPTTYNKLINNYVNIGWGEHYVREDLNIITRCFNCQGFYHKASDCKKDATCAKCAENHATKDCSSANRKCINCTNNNSANLKDTTDINHTAYSTQCPTFMNKVKIAKQRIMYTEDSKN